MMVELSGCSLLEPNNPWDCPCFCYRHKNCDRMGCLRVSQGEGAHTEGAAAPWAVPSLLPLVSLAAMPMLQKESYHNPNLRICSDTSNNEQLVKVLN